MTQYLLAGSKPVLLRPDGTVQVGWDPGRAVQITPPEGMSQTQLAGLLRMLQSGATRDELSSAATSFVSTGRGNIDELLAALVESDLVAAATARPARSASIRIHGRGPLSELLDSALQRSGARVCRAAKRHSSAIPPHTDLVVLADYLVTEPPVVRELHRARVAHLPVRVRDGTGVVGPLVIPGVTSCLQCADLHRSDRDSAWPAVAAQLRGTVGSANRATILATAALALKQVDVVISAVSHRGDPRYAPAPPQTLDTTLELDADGYSVSARHWTRHPCCSC